MWKPERVSGPGCTLVMGVVNLTPDSFSDGGRFASAEAAVAHARALVAAGADILDIGGESTRPGAEPVGEAEELARVMPVIEALAGDRTPLSVDTAKPAVARAAMAAGAAVWNDVTALRGAPESLEIAAALGCTVVLMHSGGEPGALHATPAYADVVGEVEALLLARAQAAMAAGVRREAIWLDPGLGFGKTAADNLALLRALPHLAAHDFPLLVGASRKRTVAAVDPTATDPADRLGGSLALALYAAAHGAGCVRVHDVRETVQALAVQAALAGG